MKTLKQRWQLGKKLLLLVFSAALLLPLMAMAAVEETFPVLQTKTATYTNVTVTKKTQDWIFILHSTGMGNIKIGDLPLDVQRKLGYGMERKLENSGAGLGKLLQNPKLTEVKKIAEEQSRKFSAAAFENARLFYFALGVAALGYVFSSICTWLICRKTHNSPGLLAWIPGLQLLPLLRAANMSRAWFLAFLVPGLNLLAAIIWSTKIVQARGKSPWVTFFLLLPVTSVFAYVYLAFSSDAPVEIPRPATESLVLETA